MKFAKLFVVLAVFALVFAGLAQAETGTNITFDVTLVNYSSFGLTMSVDGKESCFALIDSRCSIEVEHGRHLFRIFETENPESMMMIDTHISGPKIWEIGDKE